MATKAEISKFVKSQKSIWLYRKVQKAFEDVLSSMSDEDYREATEGLYLMVLHESALGQLMHFPRSKGKFKILQLSIATKAPDYILRYVIAHELGHGMQKRNWKKSDKGRLEASADAWAKKWGFPRDEKVEKWMNAVTKPL